MINQTLHPLFPERKQATFGSRLKSARESMGIDRKEAAAQLRLQEKLLPCWKAEIWIQDYH